MADHKVVSREAWTQARLEHLKHEKALSRQRDALARERRELPWVVVDKAYNFDSSDGPKRLSDLFGDCSQLLTYHFMFHPDWQQGCKSCSLIADSYCGAVSHLRARDVSLVTVSKASLGQIESFRTRMGWDFPWVSSGESDFNRDFHVSFTEEEIASGTAFYNYRDSSFPEVEGPGISAFIRDADGTIYHTYSSYGRGLDMFMTNYHLLDIAPRGRDEGALPYAMAWVRHHDRYDAPGDPGAEGFH